jgi:outer membrane protein OmpA-like peptidoglycan-associated protein
LRSSRRPSDSRTSEKDSSLGTNSFWNSSRTRADYNLASRSQTASIYSEKILSDEQEDSHSLVGWIIGVAVTIAVAVAVLLGIMSALENDSSTGKTTTAATDPATLAPSVPIAAPQTINPGATPAVVPPVSAAAAAITAPPAAKVYFDVNSFATHTGTNQVLADMVAYSKISANAKLSISGFHDQSGDLAKNQELAKNRAKVVKDLLLSAGVPEDRIMMQKPTETTGGADDKEARRVEVSAAQ